MEDVSLMDEIRDVSKQDVCLFPVVLKSLARINESYFRLGDNAVLHHDLVLNICFGCQVHRWR